MSVNPQPQVRQISRELHCYDCGIDTHFHISAGGASRCLQQQKTHATFHHLSETREVRRELIYKAIESGDRAVDVARMWGVTPEGVRCAHEKQRRRRAKWLEQVRPVMEIDVRGLDVGKLIAYARSLSA